MDRGDLIVEELRGKVAVVTGGASGIGFGMARAFAAEGMKVVLADIEDAALEQAVASIDGEAVGVRTDVSDRASVEALAERAIDAFGAVHIVCNNAGVGGGGLISEVSLDDWDWVLGVNLYGVIHGVSVFLPRLLAQGEGHIVNTASMAGLTTAPFMGPYNVSKFGVVALSETLQKELALQQSAVGVSVLCPGFVNTRIGESSRNRPGGAPPVVDLSSAESPMGEIMRQMIASGMDPLDVAGLVVEAVKDNRFYILSHPDMKPAIRQRMEDIVEGRNPGMPSFAFSPPER